MYSHTLILPDFVHCVALLLNFLALWSLGGEASTTYNVSTANASINISVSLGQYSRTSTNSPTLLPVSDKPSTSLSLVQLADVLPASSSLSLLQLVDVLPSSAPLSQTSDVPMGSSDASNGTSSAAGLSAVLGVVNISYTSTFAGVVRTFVNGHLLEGTALVNASTDTRMTTWTTTFSGPGGVTDTRTYPQALLDECYTAAWNANWSASGLIPCGSTRVPDTSTTPIWMNTKNNTAFVDGFIPAEACYINFDYVDVFYWPPASSNTDCLSIVDQATFDGKMSGVWNTSGLHAREVQRESSSDATLYPPVTQRPILRPEARIEGRGVNGSMIAYGPNNLTFTSPSVYGIFSHVAAYRNAPFNIVKGPYFEAITLAFAPGELSTSGTFLNADPFNFADFPCPPSNVSYVPKPGQPYKPRLRLPERLRTYLPEWNSCGEPFSGGYDPPRALDPIVASTTSATAIRPTLPSPSQVPDSLPIQTSVTSAGDPPVPTSIDPGTVKPASQNVPGQIIQLSTKQPVIPPSAASQPPLQSSGLGGIIQSVFNSVFQPPSPTTSNPSPVQGNPNPISGDVGPAPQSVQPPSPMTSNPSPVSRDPNPMSVNAGSAPANGGTPATGDPGNVASLSSVTNPIEALGSQFAATMQGKTSNSPVTVATAQNAANPIVVNPDGAVSPPSIGNSMAALGSQFAASLQGKMSKPVVIGSVAQNTGAPAAVVQGQTILEGGAPINIGGTSIAYSAGSIHVGTSIVAMPTPNAQQGAPILAVIGSLTFSAVSPNPSAPQAGVIQGQTISIEGPPAYINGHIVSYTPGMTDFNGLSVSATQPSSVAAVISGQTLYQGGSPITVGGNAISYSAGSIYVGSSAVPAPTQPPAGVGVVVNSLTFFPTQVYAPQTSAMPIVVGSQTAALLGGSSGLLIGSYTIVPGAAPVTISGTGYSLAPSATQLVVGSSTIPVPPYQPLQAIQSSGFLSLASSDLVIGTSKVPISAALGHTFTIAGQALTLTNPSAIVFAGSTISANGPGVTLSPQQYTNDVPIFLGSNALMIGTSSIALSAAMSQTFTVNEQSFTLTNSLALALGSTILSAGGAVVTISAHAVGNTISLDSQNLVIGKSSIPISAALGKTYTVDGQTFTLTNPSALAIDSTTLSAGGAGITLPAATGDVISLGSQNLVLGTSTLPISAALGKTYTVDGQTFTLTNPSTLAIGSTTLSAGGVGITLPVNPNNVISLNSQDVVLGTSTIPISAALGKIYTINGQTFTFTNPSGLAVGMTTLRPGQGETLVALPTVSGGGTETTSAVKSSQSGNSTDPHASGAGCVRYREGGILRILWILGLGAVLVHGCV